jgi:effector-binding domain-containing protein
MLTPPKIITIERRLVAVIHLTIPWSDVQNAMEPGLSELTAKVSAQGAGPSGPWFNHHLRVRRDFADFEIGVPLRYPIRPVGRVECREEPAIVAAQAIYAGGYEGLGPGWFELNKWVKAHGYDPAKDFWECYSVGPELSLEPSSWRTELTRPIAGLAARSPQVKSTSH